ncbi:11-beta-hydroxysteroid dehydrogenase type 2-like isoform X1 [Stegostoma tigrinum]|uniref:11-beta-hydroxysteroid dehydrogenase type 2-like isoform X1 n=1 Tax=Stegostoma tigrinum TaxID=3053191 RepID=UPI00202B745C|nr:11-beta-hydroxysteroid dehydrogenase type 2-like isoform X1 [Stegostoma tigrinum]
MFAIALLFHFNLNAQAQDLSVSVEMEGSSSSALGLYVFFTVVLGTAVAIHFRKSEARLNLSPSSSVFLLLLVAASLCSIYLPQYVGFVLFNVCCFLVYRSLCSNGILSPKGKTVLITGCDSGFGHTLAKRLHSLGFRVFALVLQEESDGAQELKSICSDRLTVIEMDVTNHAVIQEVQKEVAKQLNGRGLFALVNNAGIIIHIGDAEIIPTDAYKRCMEVNFLGTVQVTKAFLPLIRQAKGRIVNISSPSGELPLGSMSAYGASKAALEFFSDILRQEMKPWGVKISIIQPGATKTAHVGNVNFWTQQHQKLVDGLSPELLHDYGEEYIDEIRQRIMTIGSLFRQQVGPVIDTIVTALLAQNPKPRYSTEFVIDVLKALYYFLPSLVTDIVLNQVFIAHRLSPKGARRGNISQ